MAQRLALSVRAGDVVALLAIVVLMLPSRAAGERLALAGTLFAAGVCLGEGRTTSSCGRFAAAAAVRPRSSGTSAVTGARRAGRAP